MEGRSLFISTYPGRVEHSTRCSFLVVQGAAWRPLSSWYLGLGLGCYWSTWHTSGKWTRISITSWVYPYSFWCRPRPICWWYPGPGWQVLGLPVSQESLCFLGLAMVGFQSRGWRNRGTWSINLLGRFLGLGGSQTFLEGCSSLWGFQQLLFLFPPMGLGGSEFIATGSRSEGFHCIIPL